LKTVVAAGKGVFIEKPLALTAADSQEAMAAAQAHRVPVYVGFQRRSDHHRLELARIVIGSGAQPELIHVSSRDAPAHNSAAYLVASGSFFFDSLIHDIDECCWLAQDIPSEVYCVGHAWIPEIAQSNDVDSVAVVLKFPNQTLASITNNRSAAYGYDQRVEVHTAAGMVQCANEPRHQVIDWSSAGIRTAPQESNGIIRYRQAYQSEVHHFLNLLCGRETQSRVSPTGALLGSFIAEAARTSLLTGQPIRLHHDSSA
jgi:myo-inositol 2-dehydrogenase/D-chiro-inositol 1-dehydrogenase